MNRTRERPCQAATQSFPLNRPSTQNCNGREQAFALTAESASQITGRATGNLEVLSFNCQFLVGRRFTRNRLRSVLRALPDGKVEHCESVDYVYNPITWYPLRSEV